MAGSPTSRSAIVVTCLEGRNVSLQSLNSSGASRDSAVSPGMPLRGQHEHILSHLQSKQRVEVTERSRRTGFRAAGEHAVSTAGRPIREKRADGKVERRRRDVVEDSARDGRSRTGCGGGGRMHPKWSALLELLEPIDPQVARAQHGHRTRLG